MSITEGRHRDRDLGCTGGQAGIDVCLEEQKLPRDNNEAIYSGRSSWLRSSVVSDWLGRGY